MTKRGGNAVNAAAEWVDIRSLVPWERNPVVHTNAEIEELRALVASSVWTDPLVARRSDRRIIAGHRRRLAALSALEKDPAWTLPDAPGIGLVPVRFVEVDDETAARLTIADNAMTKQSQWDDGELIAMLREIEDPSGLGFDDEELAAMLVEPKAAPEATDDVPEAQVEVRSKPGEVYELGPHRLWCGDNTDPAIRAAACAGVGAVVTDPPYGIDHGRGGSFKASHWWGKNRESVEWDADRPQAESFAWMLSASPIVVLWGGNYFTDLVPPTMGWLIWDKGQREFSLADCEMAWTSRQKAARVITYSRGAAMQDGKEHPTQKPIAVMVWTLEKTCEDVATVLDPYGGSGTTLLACAQTGRVARVIELDPRYCDVIRRRWTRYAKEAGIDAGSGALDG